ncbi:MAG: MBL fold metallo-hydrolase, partial [Candidatus Helarchaeota archaeon]
HAVIGGFHLFKITEKRLNDTLEYFKKINPKIISPMHCTSRQFYDHIKVELQDPVVNSTVGTVFNF